VATRLPVRVLVLMHHKEYLSAGDDAKLLLAMMPQQSELFVFGRAGDVQRLEAEMAVDPAHTLLLWPGEHSSSVDEYRAALPPGSPWRTSVAQAAPAHGGYALAADAPPTNVPPADAPAASAPRPTLHIDRGAHPYSLHFTPHFTKNVSVSAGPRAYCASWCSTACTTTRH
jgi:hypothetical protein